MKAIIVILFLSIILSSCSLSPIKTAYVSTYTITNHVKKIGRSRHALSHKTLFVTEPTASPGYGSSQMIYEITPYQLEPFSDHAWVAPPAELLLPLIANQLRATHYFHAVVTSPFVGGTDYQLSTRLLVLQQEFLRPQSVVRLEMEVTLINTVTGQVVTNRVFETVVPCAENNPYSGVMATNLAAHMIVNKIARFVVRNVR